MKYWLKIIILFLIISFCFGSNAQALNLKDAFKVDDGTPTKGSDQGDPLDLAAREAGIDISAKHKGTHLDATVANIIQIGLTFLGVAFILLMLYGGFLWMTDQGNEEQVEKAKKIIRNSLIGLVIVVAAYAISWFVISVFGAETLQPPLEINN